MLLCKLFNRSCWRCGRLWFLHLIHLTLSMVNPPWWLPQDSSLKNLIQHLSHEENPRILSVKSWLFNRVPYFMLRFHPRHLPKKQQNGAFFFIAYIFRWITRKGTEGPVGWVCFMKNHLASWNAEKRLSFAKELFSTKWNHSSCLKPWHYYLSNNHPSPIS